MKKPNEINPILNTIQLIWTAMIRNIVISLPPDAEQKAIITEIENRLSNVTNATRVVDTNLRRSEIFRQSILKQAFSGRLVPQTKG